MKRVAIVGAGIAGLSCANALDPARFSVDIFDAARVPGGRVTTKKVGLARFDVGAPYFAVTGPAFRAEVSRWETRCFVARFLPRWSPDSAVPHGELWTGTPGMSAIPRELASELRLRWDSPVSRVDGDRLFGRHGELLGEFDLIVLALAGTALGDLLGSANPFPDVTARKRLSVSISWSRPSAVDWSAGAWRTGLLERAVKEAGKPDRPEGEHWVAYLSPEASAQFSPAAEAARAAVDELGRRIGALDIGEGQAHHWEEDVGQTPHSVRINEAVLACGLSPSVEEAWLRGQAAAARLSE